MTPLKQLGILIIILILILFVLPLLAAAQTVVPKTPPTELQVCENNLDHFRSELERAENSIKQLSELNDQLLARIMSLKEPAAAIPRPRQKPAQVIEACAPKTGQDRCKPGRTADPKHNCLCGRW